MKFVVLALLVVFVIGFFVVLWKAARNWRWFHWLSAAMTMLLAVIFLFPTAGVLKSRSAWHQLKEQLEVQFSQVSEEQQRLKYGDRENPEAGQGIMRLRALLSQVDREAGRRWRNLQLQNAADNSITLLAPPPPEGIPGEPVAAPQPAAAAGPMIPEGLVVYGFAETPNEQQQLLPTLYLGEFVVTASTPTSVNIEPTAPLEETQQQAIQSGQARSWSLYELLPLDGHSMFIAAASSPSDENALGRVDDELVKSLFGDRISPETLAGYLRDGSRVVQSDPPLSRWTKIEFARTEKIDVDAEGQQSAVEGGYFDGIGRAIDGRLQKGGVVEFQKGDQLIVKEEVANRLIDEGAARLVDRYFLRPLNDYRFVLRQIRLRLTELTDRMKAQQFEQQVLKAAAEKTQKMLVQEQTIRLKLEQDLAQFVNEKKAIRAYQETMRTRVEQMRTEMKQLHLQNIALEQQLDSLHGISPNPDADVAAAR
jgi:hypothetical protein